MNESPANIILQQLGGSSRLKVMIGHRKDFFSNNNEKTLQFKFKLCKAANCVEITINNLDLYDIKFIKINKITSKIPVETVEEFNNVFGDKLQEVFEEFTGLQLSI